MKLNNGKVTLVTGDQAFGEKRLSIFNELGLRCQLSDFAILLGAIPFEGHYIKKDNIIKVRYGKWFLSSPAGEGHVGCVTNEGGGEQAYAGKRGCSVRPVLPFLDFTEIIRNWVWRRRGFFEIEYGEYPQYAVNKKLSDILEEQFKTWQLKKTGKTYTTDARSPDDWDSPFAPYKHIEYEYNGKRYIRVKCKKNALVELSNRQMYKDGDSVWVEVSPIKWIVDEKAKLLVSKNLLVSGIRFCDSFKYNNVRQFKKTEMYMFLKEFFAKDIVPSISNEILKTEGNKNGIFSKLKNVFKRKEQSIQPIIKEEIRPQEESKKEEKKNKESEITDENINKLCDYIIKKSSLLISTKRKIVLEKLNKLLEINKREIEDLDSEMYVKYGLTLVTREQSKLSLWKGLYSLKLDIDRDLKDKNLISEKKSNYINQLKNLIDEYRTIDKQGYSDKRNEYIKRILELVDKINSEYNTLTPYLRIEALELIFLSFHIIVNIPWQYEYRTDDKTSKVLDDKEIADSLILWFDKWYLENEDKLSPDLQKKYSSIKKGEIKDNKFAYIVELAKIIDPTLMSLGRTDNINAKQ